MPRPPAGRWAALVLVAGVLAACAAGGVDVGGPTTLPATTVPATPAPTSAPTRDPTSAPTSAPTSTAEVTTTTEVPPTVPPPLNLYEHTTAGKLSPAVAGIPHRVYVPNSDEHTVSVIDPATMTVIAKHHTGRMPHHITPSWDLSTLYVLDTEGNSLTPIDPRTAAMGTPIPVTDPYNLYFTPDGQTALVIAERYQRIDLRDPSSWELIASIPVPHPGVNHGDFSADGRYFYATCEFSGWVVKVDLVERRLAVEAPVGIKPIDVKMAPDASVVYVADQGRHGVMLLHPDDLREIGFLATGKGTHGLYPSRDGTKLYASNRLGGTVSVIDFASRQIEATWTIPGGGSPDMGSVSADGTQLWLSGRYHGEVYVFDTATGALLHRIRTGAGPHGLTYFPQPGRYSLGHTGNYR